MSVWREGVCGFNQVAHTGISISGHTRVQITVVACAGDQVRRRLSDSFIRYKASIGLEDLFVTVSVKY